MIKYLDNLNQTSFKLYRDIADTISRYYPKGNHPFDENYSKSQEIMGAFDIIYKNIGTPKQKTGSLAKLWRSLLKEIKGNSLSEIEGTTFGFCPGFSADMILEKYEDKSLIRIKRIAFAVSMLGPFYSICGIDETIIKADEKFYHAINVVTVSPYKELESTFNLIKGAIEKIYPEYAFLPFDTCMLRVKDTYSLNSLGEEDTVYSFLFNHLFRYYTHHYSRGNRRFGYPENPNIKVTLTAPPPTD